jgi:hypothetical protein
LITKFEIGDKVKVISLGWDKPDLVGRTGIIIGISQNFADFCIYFKNWRSGHVPDYVNFKTIKKIEHFKDLKDLKDLKVSCWNLGTRIDDKFIKANTQLELNFEGEEGGR